EEAYPRLNYGDRGTAVRNMQRRLNTLGYPVGKVDGVWGENTQLAVNLFQCALGWTERDYASSAMQEKLYSRNAPQYDPYAPLREGDKGTDVKLMQQALFDLGYLGTDEEEEVDGKYGPITTAAIIQFQAAAGYMLEDTGYADADTLFLLFSEDAPRNPALSQPTDPNYPEFIVPDTPPATDTDLVIWIEPRS
ncbi:MAG: peptidoglycan-binding protein, partial [Clostridia bacterium]|nr:peptidoglycan-binding protein [Clostridia bacterium]